MQRTFTLPPTLLRRLVRIAAKERIAPVKLVAVAVTELVAAYEDARQTDVPQIAIERERERERVHEPCHQPTSNGTPVHPAVAVRDDMTKLEVVWNGAVDRERAGRRG